VPPATFDSQSRPRRNPETAFRSVGEDGGLVVLPGKAEVKVLNPAGIKIFSLLDGEHTADQIAEALTEEFEVTRENALQDVLAFVQELSDHGMLQTE
jgi:hypothetical protein